MSITGIARNHEEASVLTKNQPKNDDNEHDPKKTDVYSILNLLSTEFRPQLYGYIAKYITLYRALRIYSSARLSLGRIYIVLSDDVERRLRLTIVKRLGGKKGDLSGAVEEAVNDWLGKDWVKIGDRM